MNQPVIVILVDNKRRDLPASALIAEHIEQLGGTCILAPLEGYRSVLQAYKPSLILFNHLLAMHLVEYSQRLQKIGVKVAVLPNEMLLYHRDFLLFNTRKRHPDTHVDVFFSWGEFQRDALYQNGYDSEVTTTYVVGNPKFDFYYKPYSNYYSDMSRVRESGRPRILICTNFCFAKYQTLPREESDRFFALWHENVPIFKNYPSAVATASKSRERFMEMLDVIVRAQKYDITLRPHPNEDSEFYKKYLDALPANLKSNVTFDLESTIYEQILNCDLEISCETCTTALESWISKKPTVELLFEKHEMYYHHDISLLNVTCEAPEQLIDVIDAQLADPEQSDYSDKRAIHLKKWVDTPRGDSCLKVAKGLVKEANSAKPDWSKLEVSDMRRGIKHRLLEFFGKPCNYKPLISLVRYIMPSKYRVHSAVMAKTATPIDIREARMTMGSLLGRS